jgi:hypothetical protein
MHNKSAMYVRVTLYWGYVIVLWLFHLVCILYCVCFNLFCNVWVCVCVGFVMCGCVYVWVLWCVGVWMCGFCDVWVYVCVGFVMYGCVCVCVCGFCNVWVCVCVCVCVSRFHITDASWVMQTSLTMTWCILPSEESFEYASFTVGLCCYSCGTLPILTNWLTEYVL